MKIIVVGFGKVGYVLTDQLNDEGHDLTVIDTNESRMQYAISQLDIQAITGNGTSYLTQMEAGIQDSDLLIAVTDHDEINLLSCLIAKKAGNCHTIARVRNPEYFKEINFIKEELGLSMSINPELAAAMEIAHLIQIPSAMEIDTFARGRVNLIKFRIPPCSPILNVRVSENPLLKECLLCVVQRRDKSIVIPDGNTVLTEGDIISVIIPLSRVFKFFSSIGIKTRPIRDVLIVGGSTIAYYLAVTLIRSRIKVKIIEQKKSRCDELSALLPEAMIICGDASNRGVLDEEGIKSTDAFVSLTNLDEENIMLSLYANKVSSAKIITKINKIDFEEVISDMPIGSIICPKNITAEGIIQYVRSMQNSFGSNVETLYRMMDNRVEALEFVVREESPVTNIPLMDLNLKENLIICCINRSGRIITPSGKDIIRKGDSVVVVTTKRGLNDIRDIIKD
ncbi:Trk system potassium transporter TrkA [Lachnospiraceae bacterium NSJ-143]|nr:Trk system potassium transporter TrkA [Lachnospiraceae bacterium NSJ-143]